MKTSILLFSFLFSFVAFGQKNNIRSKPTRSAPSKPAVRTAPRPNSSPVSRPSRPARQSRPAVSRPSKPSSSGSNSTNYAAPSIQQHSTKHPAPHTSSSSSSNSNRQPSGNNSSTSNATSPSSSANSSSYINYSSQSCGTNPRTGYYNSFGPMVGVSGTGFEYGRLARLTGGQYVNYPSNQVVRAIQDVITQNANDSTDVVILVDISGSMKNNVNDISKESHQIVQAMPYGSRLGGAVFKYSKSPKWFNYSDLNEDHYYALDLITKKRKYYSSESHYDALLKAMNANTWKNRKRMVITITDEFIESGENYNSESTIVSVANAKNIELHTIKLNY
tara:strand:- start:942 stop:1943 length:1002 start_codon:yes stop_codon:yes gene_type:complete